LIESNSEEELQYLRYLIRKYIPGLRSQGKEMPTVMFNEHFSEDTD
jgi:hypothetical protein